MKIENLTQKPDGTYVMGVALTFQELIEILHLGLNVCFGAFDEEEEAGFDDGLEHEMPEEMQ